MTTLLPASGRKLNPSEQLGPVLLEQLVDVLSRGDGKASPARVHAIVLPMLRPFLRGFDELTGEAPGVRKSVHNLQTAGQADIDVRLHDGKLTRRETLLMLALLELVDVDPNFVFRLVAAGQDLNGARDLRRRIVFFALGGGVELLFAHCIDNSVPGARFLRDGSDKRGDRAIVLCVDEKSQVQALKIGR